MARLGNDGAFSVHFANVATLACGAALVAVLSGCSGAALETPSPGASEDAVAEVTEAVTENAMELCPSADEAEHVVSLWSVVLLGMDDAEPEMARYMFSNALGETVDVVVDDSDSLPCVGQDTLYDTAVEWNSVLEDTLEEKRMPTDDELQKIADLGNLWLSEIEADNLNFSINPVPSDIGN